MFERQPRGNGSNGLIPERVSGRDAAALENALGVMLEEAWASGLDVRTLTPRARVSPDAVEVTVAELVERERAVRLGETLVVPAVLAHAKARLLEDLRAYHRSQPLSEGLPREEARERLFRRAHPVVFERVLADLVADRRITARDRLALADHQVSLSGDEARAREAIEQAYREAGLRPPDLATLRASIGIGSDMAGRIANLLVRQKVLVKVDCAAVPRVGAAAAERRRWGSQTHGRGERSNRSGYVQGALRHYPKIRDSTPRVSGPRAHHAPDGGVPDRDRVTSP